MDNDVAFFPLFSLLLRSFLCFYLPRMRVRVVFSFQDPPLVPPGCALVCFAHSLASISSTLFYHTLPPHSPLPNRHDYITSHRTKKKKKGSSAKLVAQTSC